MRCLGIAALGALLFLLSPARADVLVSISKSQQQMTVSVDGVPTYHWTVSTGRAGYDTPAGSYRAIRMERVYYSKKFDDAPMPNSVFFYGGYAIHGTMQESQLGSPASHGCVRLARVNAETLFALVRARGMSNTRVVIGDGAIYVRPVPMARVRPRYPGFQQFGARSTRDTPPPRRVVETRRYERAVERHPARDDGDASREAWLRSLDRKYGVNTR
jgi:hypothetical protein